MYRQYHTKSTYICKVNKSRAEKKKRRILWLTIASQMILGAFVFYWLTEQFKVEKEQLEEELTHQYFEAEDQVIDRVLLKKLINPALGDSMHLTLNLKTDTTNHIRLRHNADFTHIEKKEQHKDTLNEVIAIGYVSETDSSSKNKQVYHFNRLVKEDALKRSVKLIINHTDSFDSNRVRFRNAFPFPLDSALFKKIFEDSLSVKKMSFRMNWYVDSNYANNKHEGITIKGGIYNDIPAVSVSKYGIYLLTQIWPQILFGVFLLLLSGAALTFSYRSFKKQMQLNMLRTDFISNITHELKTPVSTAKVALEALQTFDMKKDAKVADKYLKMVSVEMNRLDALTNKVLNHSKLEAHGLVLQLEEVDLQNLVQAILSKLAPLLSELDASVHFNKVIEPKHIFIDPVYVEQVITNLIDNGLKYATPNPEINISMDENEKYVLLLVEDNGPGIPKEYLSKVFENFFRVPSGDTHNVKGHGLGLSLAAMVMKQHNGKIEVENLSGKGCRFILKFPK